MICERLFIAGKKSCYCEHPELIENYDKAISDETQVWHCHHRLETHNSDGVRRTIDLSHDELKALDMYWNRPPEELIFLTAKEHRRLHNVNPETRAKISEAKKGKHYSEEHKARIYEAMKGNQYHKGKCHSEEAKAKMSEAHKGKHWKLVDGKRVYY